MEVKILEKLSEKLDQLIKNTGPKETHQINVSSKQSEFIKVFNPSLQLDPHKQYEMALVGLHTWYSFQNISNYNNTLHYINKKTKITKKIEIPPGSYEIKGLNKEIQRQLDTNEDDEAFELIANTNTFKSILNIKENYKVLFKGHRSIKEILGFTKNIYDSGINESENIVNILPVNSILLHTNITQGSILNGSSDSIIYSFFPKVTPGHKITQEPINPIYLPLSTNLIRDFYIKVTDQDNNILDFRGDELTFTFHIRQK